MTDYLSDKLLETKRIRKLDKKGNTTITLSHSSGPLWEDLKEKLLKHVPNLPKRLLSLFTETMIRTCQPRIKQLIRDFQDDEIKVE